jgi:hypothetical protein
MPGVHETSASKRVYAESAAPSTPPSGEVYVYAKAGGKLYIKDDAGLETALLPTGMAIEVDYVEFTAGGSITATSEGSADTVVTAGAVTFDGSTEAIIEFSAPNARPDTGAASRTLNVWLFEDGSSIGQLGLLASPAAGGANAPLLLRRLLTPASGSRTYSIRATVNVGTGVITAGAGGAGNQVPGYIRVSKKVV